MDTQAVTAQIRELDREAEAIYRSTSAQLADLAEKYEVSNRQIKVSIQLGRARGQYFLTEGDKREIRSLLYASNRKQRVALIENQS